MKRFALITAAALVAMMLFAGIAAAAPGDYDPHNTSVWWSVYDMEPGSNVDIRTTVGDWDIINANMSGETGVAYFKTDPVNDPDFFDTYQRNVYGQLVHTDFQLNTNSCASCHMTHTAQSRGLLFRNGVYNTCTACHDGTLGFLNVFAPPTEDQPWGGSITAGTFGVEKSRNASVHLANGVMEIAAAPGGNRAKVAVDEDNGAGSWGSEFNCGSCHAPHGSYSIRLLHYNPNNISLRKRLPQSAQEANSGGLWEAGFTAQSVAPGSYLYKFTVSGAYAGAPWLYGYNGATTGMGIFSGRNPRFFTRIYDIDYYDPNTVGGPMATIDGTRIMNRFLGINYAGGYFYVKDEDAEADLKQFMFERFGAVDYDIAAQVAAGKVKVDIGYVMKVTAQAQDVSAEMVANGWALPQYSSNYIDPTSYSGIYPTRSTVTNLNRYAYNLFCAACHTDYLMGSASGQGPDGKGIYSKAFRHTINRGATGGGTMPVKGTANSLLCVSCHYGHGVDSSFMLLADTTLVDADELSTGAPNPFQGANDVNPSSALKRYINQAVCWSCHANSSAATLKNSQWYWDGYDDGRGNW